MQGTSNYLELKTSEEANAWADRHFGAVLAMPSDSPLYKSILGYTGSCYEQWNPLLRRSPPIEEDSFSKHDRDFLGEELDEIKSVQAFLLQNETPEDIVVYRYTRIKDVQSLCGRKLLRSGMYFSDKAFFSTTLVKGLLSELGTHTLYTCILKLYLPKGVPGAYVSLRDERSRLDEQEFLLPCGTEFEILRVHWWRFPWLIECKALMKEKGRG